MSWIISLMSFIMLWLMGNKSKWGPVVGLINQILWIIYVFMIKEWGLLPGVLAFTFVHIRNLRKWWLDENRNSTQ